MNELILGVWRVSNLNQPKGTKPFILLEARPSIMSCRDKSAWSMMEGFYSLRDFSGACGITLFASIIQSFWVRDVPWFNFSEFSYPSSRFSFCMSNIISRATESGSSYSVPHPLAHNFFTLNDNAQSQVKIIYLQAFSSCFHGFCQSPSRKQWIIPA